MHPTIAIIGNLTIDELVQRRKVTVSPGGSALFSSGAAVTLGARVLILGNIGRDYPQTILRRLDRMGLDIGSLKRTDGSSTRFRIAKSNQSRQLKLLASGRPVTLPRKLRFFQGVHLGPVFNEISSSVVKTVRGRCDFLSADLQGFIRTVSRTGTVHTKSRRLGRLLRQCNLVQASIEEARSQIGSEDPIEILEYFRTFNVPFSIVTVGKQGSWLSADDHRVFYIPAFRDENVQDSTGAGDIFAGSWVTTYLATNDPVWASAVSSAFASIASRSFGLAKFRVDKKELFRRARHVYDHVKLA